MSVIVGDCIEEMAKLPAESVHAIVCDPPAGISFMGRSWDGDRGGMEQWTAWMTEVMAEALRVCKPGAHALVWALPRTSHWTGMALERAGWDVRDCITHLFGSGFPKSLDVSRAIDKAAGADREVLGKRPISYPDSDRWGAADGATRGERNGDVYSATGDARLITAPATPDAERWDGYGTALKPAAEFWFLARKPLASTVAANCLRYGTGALNVDGCRVGYEPGGTKASNPSLRETINGGNGGHVIAHESERRVVTPDATGRFPPNLVLSHSASCQPVGTRRVKSGTAGAAARGFRTEYVGGEPKNTGLPPATYADADGTEEVPAYRCVESCPVRLLDEQTGTLTSGREAEGGHRRNGDKFRNAYGDFTGTEREPGTLYGDSGGASRFFPTFDARHEEAERRFLYCAKAPSAERNAGLDGFEERQGGMRNNVGRPLAGHDFDPVTRNVHPTVKPIALMRWLVRLVTPPGGTVLDCFAGSGTTGCAAALEGFDFIGIEQDPTFAAIADARIAWWSEHPDGMALVKRLEFEKRQAAVAESGQASLFAPADVPPPLG